MRVAVIVVWRPKGITGWNGRDTEPGRSLPPGLSVDPSCAPYTGTHLASLLPRHWEIELINETVRDVDTELDVDAVLISSMDYCAEHARTLASRFKARDVRVVVGGLYATVRPDYFADVADAVVVGEAEPVIERLCADLEAGRLEPLYRAERVAGLDDLPVPRYDLVERDFTVPCTYEVTRGCPFTCSFCILSSLPTPFRKRPIPHVIRDLQAIPADWKWHQRKMALFLDNNLGADRYYFRDLCEALAPLKRGFGTQTSIDTITPESAKLMRKAGFLVVYIGLESLSQQSLKGAAKKQNRVQDYKRRLGWLHDNGILVMSIFLLGMDGDMPQYLEDLPNLVHEVGVDLPVFSFPAPLESTPFRAELLQQDRLLPGDLNYAMDGSHLVYKPRELSPDDVEAALFRAMRIAYGPKRTFQRIARRLRLGWKASLFNASSNLHYWWYERAIAETSLERLRKRGPWPGVSAEAAAGGSDGEGRLDEELGAAV
jgi:radical SAM superfamily enzyme YgiQ (UPF0313 family)